MTDYSAPFSPDEPISEPTPEPVVNDKPDKPKPAKRSPRPRRTAGEVDRSKRGLIREAIDRYETMSQADDSVRAACAALAGCDDDPTEIAVFASTKKIDTSAVSTLVELRDVQDDLLAVVNVSALVEDKGSLRTLWSLLSAVADVPAEPPVKKPVTAAAADLVRTVRDLDDSAVDTLNSAVDALS